ncbi:MAG: hypothetical protein HRU23_19895 [Gammaproteobacteria bacterium]|nr:hypothetical protein [Gammaproteobacteria bacterium]
MPNVLTIVESQAWQSQPQGCWGMYLSWCVNRHLYANIVHGRLHIGATRIRYQQSDHIAA